MTPSHRTQLLVCLSVLLSLPAASAAQVPGPAGEYLRALEEQGFTPEQFLGLDPDGIPKLCGTDSVVAESSSRAGARAREALQPGERSFELIPGVIYPDGQDAFTLEVDTNGPVAAVRVIMSAFFVAPGQTGDGDRTPVPLRDDGLGGDRIAGDFVYSLGPIRYNTETSLEPGNPGFYPEGLQVAPLTTDFNGVPCLEVEELDGSRTRMLACPSVGLLSPELPLEGAELLSEAVQRTSHLINVKTATFSAQRFLRGGTLTLTQITQAAYALIPDVFDFLIFFSTNRMEKTPRLSGPNFVAGAHSTVKVDYTGTGLSLRDNSALWGSSGRLQGLNVLDGPERGLSGNNAVHELLHQWAAYANAGVLGINGQGSHYDVRSSVGSILGGYRWIDHGDGTYGVQCEPRREGSEGAFRAAPLDQYLMGLIDGSAVEPIRVYPSTLPLPQQLCEPGSIDQLETTVTIEEIQSLHGVRTPGPTAAQREFHIGFVAGSHDRFLDAKELTFYTTLARELTRPLREDEEAPYVSGWVPISEYFGEQTVWRSEVPSPTAVPLGLPLAAVLGAMAFLAVAFLSLRVQERNAPGTASCVDGPRSDGRETGDSP